MIKHPIPPFYNKDSEILILGSFPSVKSREQMFFYGHPQNRFWKVISAVFGADCPLTIEDKRLFLTKHRIALWDTIAECEIVGSSDSSITNVVPNDISLILKNSNVKRIFTNGKTSDKYYNKYIFDKVGIKAYCLPSTSPANAFWSLEKLVDAWKIIKP